MTTQADQGGAARAGGTGGAGGATELDRTILDLPRRYQTAGTKELVGRAQQGDAEALNDLFGHYYDMMVEMARRNLGAKLRQKEDADDLAQTTFREAARDFRAYVYRGETSLLRWLVRILQNKIRDRAEFYSARKRDLSRERNLDEPITLASGEKRSHDPASQDLSVTRMVQRREEFAILRDALERLSPEHRMAITLVFFEGLSLRDAGQRMQGRSEDAVRMLLRRAEKHMYALVRAKLGAGEE